MSTCSPATVGPELVSFPRIHPLSCPEHSQLIQRADGDVRVERALHVPWPSLPPSLPPSRPFLCEAKLMGKFSACGVACLVGATARGGTAEKMEKQSGCVSACGRIPSGQRAACYDDGNRGEGLFGRDLLSTRQAGLSADSHGGFNCIFAFQTLI